MAGRIPNELIEEVRNRSDIVELISEYLPVQKRGKNYFALCPFHPEKTPSFCVNPDRQVYHCFGCGAGGNVFTFLMEYEKVGFLEAVRTLARRVGVSLPQVGRGGQETGEYDLLYRANEFAADYYHRVLREKLGQRARVYLKTRGLGDEIIEQFRLGYAPGGWDNLLRVAGSNSIPPESLLRAGSVLAREGGEGYYDRFRDRIIFPIFNPSGRVVGFGGRTMDGADDQPKYINSPETPIYHKGKTFYGLPQSREAIRGSRKALLVEGYMDLLILFQAGFRNVVATLGTALTPDQARLLSRYAEEVFLVYDADQAGVSAAFRGAGVLLEAGLEVKVVPLPPGTDPDSLIRQKGSGEFSGLLNRALSFVDFALSSVGQKEDLSTVEGMAKAIGAVAELLGKVGDEVKRRLWVKKVADTFSIGEEVVLRSLSQVRGKRVYRDQPRFEALLPRREGDPAEVELLRLMLGSQETVQVVREHLDPEDLGDEGVRETVKVLFDLVDKGEKVEPAALIDLVNGERAKRIISQLALDQGYPQGRRRIQLLNDCIISIRRRGITRKLKSVQQKLKSAEERGDEAAIIVLAGEYKRLIEAREEFKNGVIPTH